jgi:hypothetical protein
MACNIIQKADGRYYECVFEVRELRVNLMQPAALIANVIDLYL